jgi:hypothetical protein
MSSRVDWKNLRLPNPGIRYKKVIIFAAVVKIHFLLNFVVHLFQKEN